MNPFRIMIIVAASIAVCACQTGSAGAPSQTNRASRPAKSIDTSACDGRPVTVDEAKFEDGSVRRRREVIKSEDGRTIFHGDQTTFYEQGQPKMTMTFICGTPHGERTAWYASGSTWSTGRYFNGKDHGTWTIYFADGQKRQEHTLDHGVWQGTHTKWHQNGLESMKVHYVDGLRQGWLIEWDIDGNMTKQVEYADGQVQPTPGL